MQNRGVIAPTERIANFRQAVIGKLFRQRHGYLTRTRYRTGTPFRQQIGNLDLVILGHSALDIVDADQFILQRQQVLQRFTNQFDGDIASHEVGMGDHAFQCTFQFPDVRANALSDEESCIVGQVDLRLVGLLHQNGNTGLQLRRLDRHGQTPAKTRFQTFLETIDLFRVTITGEDDLLAALEQGVEGMEELFLRALLLGEELDVVDQQRVHGAVETLELVDGIELQRLDHVRYKTLGMQVHHLRIRILLQQVIAHRMHQVGLAQADATIEKQRVVAVLGVVSDLPGSRTSQLVGFTLDEILEGERTVQVAGVLEASFHLNVALHPGLLGFAGIRR